MTLGRLAGGLAAKGWSVQVVRPAQYDEEADIVRPSSGLEELVVPGVPLPGYKGLRMGEPAVLSLLGSWRRMRPDVVHIATEGPLGVAALMVAHWLRLPIASTFHTNFDQYSDHYRVGFIQKLASSYLRRVHNLCGCTLAPTRQMADELAALGYRNAAVLSRGVDTELFRPDRRDEGLRRAWGVEPGALVALYVGRVAREKSIDLAMEAFEQIRRRHRSDIMVVVGDGPELERIRLAYPDVRYAGMRRGEDLARHYASGDLFLFPSVTETFGNVVTEAMASGLAVCSYDYAAGRQCIQPGVNGELAAFGVAEAFVERCVALRTMAPEALGRLRQAARETANAISWESVVDTFENALHQVMRQSN